MKFLSEANKWNIFNMKYQTIPLKLFSAVKGTIYYVAIATVIFSLIFTWRYRVFTRKLNWYFIGFYITTHLIVKNAYHVTVSGEVS